MANPARPEFQTRRSWRAGAGSVGVTGASKWFGRLALTLLGLALVGILGWLLVRPFFRYQTHLVVLPVVDYDALYVPPIPYSQEDTRAVEELADSNSRSFGRNRSVVLDKLKDSQAVDALLGQELRDTVRRPKDVLIFWLSAHGVSDQGVAYLLMSDFNPTGSVTGRCKLSSVLEQIHDCPAAVKLVILDSGRIVADPRLGMVANEFPRLLEQEILAIKDPHLWVLTANDWLETSHVSCSMRRSLFGYVVTTGLGGEADFNRDARIELGELYQYVRDQTSRWAEKLTRDEESQTPLLLQGGSGLVEQEPIGIELLRVGSRRSAAEPAKGAEPAKANGAAKAGLRGRHWPLLAMANFSPDAVAPAPAASSDPKPTTEAKPIDKPAVDPTAQTPPTPAQTAPAETDPPAKPASEPVLAEPKPAPVANPMPVATTAPAPNPPAKLKLEERFTKAWELRDQLEDNRRNGGWSPIDYAPHLWHEFQQLLLGYELRFRSGAAFDEAQLAADLENNILPAAGLLAASQRDAAVGRATLVARLTQARERFLHSDACSSFDRAPAQIKSAAQLGNRLLFQLPYYVQWQSRFTSPSLGARRMTEELARLTPAIEGLPTQIDQWSRGLDSESGSGGRIESLRRDLAGLEQLAADFERLVDNESAASRSINPRRWMILLATPLPSAAQRTRMLAALARDSTAPPVWSGAPRRGPVRAIGPDRWRRLRSRIELAQFEIPLAELAGAPSGPLQAAATELTQAGSDRQAADSRSIDRAWTALRSLGGLLETTYKGLPRKVRNLQDTPPNSADRLANMHTADRLLRLVDGRDAKSVAENVTAMVPLPAVARELDVTWTAPASLPLRAGDWTSLEIEVAASRAQPAAAELSSQFDRKLVEVRGSDGKPPANPTTFSLGPKATRFEFQLRAIGEIGSATSLTLLLNTDGKSFTRAIRLEPLREDAVELVVQGSEGTVNRRGRSDAIELAAYPNAITAYHLALVNHSGRPKKVKIELWGAPAADSITGPPPVLNESGRPPEGFELRGEVKQIELPGEETAVDVSFPPPAPAPAGAPVPTEKKPPAAIGGLLCVIGELTNPGRNWVKWLPIAPQRPSDYLQAEGEFDRQTGRISVVVRPVDGKRGPPLGSKIRWETGAPGQIKPLKAEGEVAAPEFQTQLFAVTDADRNPEKKVMVALTVDGWPRAFEFEIPCSQTLRHIAPLRDLQRVKFAAPLDGDALAVQESEKSQESTIPVTLEVDAPLDAFRDPADGGVLEIGFNDRQDRSLRGGEVQKAFRSDRQAAFWLEEAGPSGLLRIGTRVGDFALKLDRRGYQDLVIEIVARLTANKKDKAAFVRLALDATPPSIAIAKPSNGAKIGFEQDIEVSIEELKDRGNKDLSGIKKVECVLGQEKIASFDKSEPVAFDAQTGTWHALLPTKNLRAGEYYLTVRATDRVDLRSLPVQVKVSVRPPNSDPKTPGGRPAKTARIVGRVVFADKPQGRIMVTLTGVGSVKSDESGQFTFDDLKPGKYQLKAAGSALNKLRESDLTDVVINPAGDATVSVELMLK